MGLQNRRSRVRALLPLPLSPQRVQTAPPRLRASKVKTQPIPLTLVEFLHSEGPLFSFLGTLSPFAKYSAFMRILVVFFACLAYAAGGQDNVLVGYKMATPPTVDGVIEAGEWANVPSAMGSYDGDTGQKAPEDMKFWLAYDAKFIYFAAKMFDTQPSAIKATEYRTNVSLGGDDSVTLLVDLSGSLADFNEFGMNARGATQIQLAGGRAAKREWSGEFVAKGRITQEGWEVEARIPWKMMRLPGVGPRTLRFNVEREHKRSQRSYVWQYTGSGQQQRHGRWTDVDLPKSPVERTIKLLPYGYAGDDKDGHVANAGIDMKTNLTDQMVLVGSINPDFRNIENAILSLDFSRFERLAGETRPFFQEGRQYINSALFASQRIPGFDLGLNLHGRLSDRLSFGVLNAIDFGVQNSFVGNFTYDPNPKDSYRISTTSMTQPGFENQAYLARYNRSIGPVSVFLRTMGTRDTELGDGVSNSANVGYSRGGLSIQSGWDAVSPSFVPRLGFVPERDYRGYFVSSDFVTLVNRGPLQQIGGSASWQKLDRFDGGPYRKTFSADSGLVFRNRLGLVASISLEDFLGTFDRLYGLSARFPRGDPYKNMSLTYNWGRLDNEDYRSIGVGSAYRPIDKIQLLVTYQHVDHHDRSDLAIVGMNWDLGRDQYLSGRAVKRDRDWNAYLAFRRSGNKGIEYFLILGDPNAQAFQRILILKVVWPIEL